MDLGRCKGDTVKHEIKPMMFQYQTSQFICNINRSIARRKQNSVDRVEENHAPTMLQKDPLGSSTTQKKAAKTTVADRTSEAKALIWAVFL